MTTPVSPLVWTPSQGGGAGSLVAQVILDSSIDTDYTVPVIGKWNTETIQADGVIISNIGNNGVVSIEFGSLTVQVPPFIRDTVALGPGNSQNVGVQFSVGLITLYFYKGKPPITPQVYNYAGAAAVSNTTCFTGGDTMGTANAQTVSVQTNYQFSNGVLISASAGFTNTGPLTMNVNNMGAVPVTLMGQPLVGSELIAGTNFLLSVNADAGVFDLVSVVEPPTPVFSEKFVSALLPMPNTNTTTNVAHGLGGAPFDWEVYIVCITNDVGYAAGTIIKFNQAAQQNTGINAAADAVNVSIYMSSAGVFIPLPSAGGNSGPITQANWNLLVKAWT